MSSRNCLAVAIVVTAGAVAISLAAWASVRAAEKSAPAVGSGGEKLAPLEIKLPKPLFQGTPKNIKQVPTLEKYSEKPRPAFYAPEGVKNLAAGKKVTSSDMAPIIGELSLLTDDDTEGFDGSYVELGPGKQWVQIDLGAPASIYAICAWHYHAEGRVYHDVVVQVSDDPDFIANVKTVYNNDFDNSSGFGLGKQLEYIDDYRGKLIDAKSEKGQPVKGRYVRLYSNGNTSNEMNHYVEVEVFGKAAQ